MSEPIFSIATHDAANDERGVIAGREYYARKFTLSEVQGILAEINAKLQAAMKGDGEFTVKDEMRPVAKALGKRVADGKKPATVEQLMDALTDKEYRAVLEFYAPSLLNQDGVRDEGKAG